MIKALSHVFVWVTDQDEAKAFYVDRLGLELGTDMVLDQYGGFRWLTVRMPNGVELVLSRPETMAPANPEAPEQIRRMLAEGMMGSGIMEVDDCRATYEELRARGVEFFEEPTEHFYGVDSAFRDPAGNSWRLTQLTSGPGGPP
jgi:catechol 2,3-dioxygenase-like lactoylglutathione lyase family enzyme